MTSFWNFEEFDFQIFLTDTDTSRQLFQYAQDFADLYPGVNDSGLGDDGSF